MRLADASADLVRDLPILLPMGRAVATGTLLDPMVRHFVKDDMRGPAPDVDGSREVLKEAGIERHATRCPRTIGAFHSRTDAELWWPLEHAVEEHDVPVGPGGDERFEIAASGHGGVPRWQGPPTIDRHDMGCEPDVTLRLTIPGVSQGDYMVNGKGSATLSGLA